MHIALSICYIAFQLDQRFMVTTLHRSPTKICDIPSLKRTNQADLKKDANWKTRETLGWLNLLGANC